MKRAFFLTAGTMIAVMNLTACAPASRDELEAKDKRITDLERELRNEQRKRGEEETLRTEAEKHQARMLQCHRDFRGSYGRLIRKSVHLVRGTQRVQRYDCAGQLTKDETETVEAPRETLTLTELKDLVANDATVVVMNRQTCGGGGFRRGLTRWSAPTLWVDRANALLTHEVFEGLNLIDFGLCDARGKTPGVSADCAQPTWVATLELKVTDEEKNDASVREVRPRTENCVKEGVR